MNEEIKPIVIIIDDEPHIRALLNEFLKDKFDIIEFDSGITFLEEIHKHKPATIIIDWKMPGLTGIETIKKLKQKNLLSTVPIALNTAIECTPETMQEAVDAGITIFLQKGSSWHYIIKHIEALVNLYMAQEKQKEMTNLIVHSMQHNINGLLTGIVTIGSMLPMFDEWGEGIFFDKIDQMIESSKHLHDLNEDLNVLLTDTTIKKPSKFKINSAAKEGIEKLAYHQATVVLNCDDTIEVFCNKRDIARLIHYLGIYFVKIIGIEFPIIFDIKKDDKAVIIASWIKTNLAISELFIRNYAPNTEQGTFLLATTFVRKTVEKYNGSIDIISSPEKSGIIVKLPL